MASTPKLQAQQCCRQCRHIIGRITFQWLLGRIIYDSCHPNASNHSIPLSKTKLIEKKKKKKAGCGYFQDSAHHGGECGCSQTAARFTVSQHPNIVIIIFITIIIKFSLAICLCGSGSGLCAPPLASGTHHIFRGAVLHHTGVRHFKQQIVCQSPPSRGGACSTSSMQVPPAVLNLSGQPGGGANWRHAHRTGICRGQVTGQAPFNCILSNGQQGAEYWH